MPQDQESAATKRFLQESEKAEQTELDVTGQNEPYQLWRESMPNTRMDDDVVLGTFLEGADVESAAQEGRLEVVTGEPEEEKPAEEPAAEGEEDKDKEPGDLSKLITGEPDSDQLKPVEGMWMPPAESEAENYEYPTTREMTQSDEWLENAKRFYEFMGKPPLPSTERRVATEKFGSQAFVPPQLATVPAEANDDEIAEWAESEMARFNWNLVATASLGTKIMGSNDPKGALAALNLMNMYDFSDGGTYEFMRAVGNLGLDPTTYVGLGVGGLAAKGAAKMTAKQGLSRAVQGAIVSSTAGVIEGSALTGGFDLVKQNVEQEAGAREDIDIAQTGKAAAVGGLFGGLLAGPIGYLIGRHGDKLAKAMDDELSRQLGGSRREVAEQMTEMTTTELFEMLQASQRAQELVGGEVDDAAQIALKLLGSEDALPRLDDGTIDMEAVTQILDDIVLTREQRMAAARAAMEAEDAGRQAPMDTPVGGAEPKHVDLGMNESGRLKIADNLVEEGQLPEGDVDINDLLKVWYDDFANDVFSQQQADAEPIVKMVSPDDLYAMQHTLNRQHDHTAPPQTDIFGDPGVPVVYEFEGKLYILDGHHRIDKAAELGEQVEAHIYKSTLDPEKHRRLNNPQARAAAAGKGGLLEDIRGEVGEVEIDPDIEGVDVIPYREEYSADITEARGLSAESITTENGFIMRGDPEVAMVGKFLNDQDIWVRETTDNSILFDLDANTPNPETQPNDAKMNEIIREVADAMGLEHIDGITKAADSTFGDVSTRTLEVKGTIEELAQLARALEDARDSVNRGEFAKRWKEIYGVEPGTPPPDNVVPFPTAEARGLVPEAKGEPFVPGVSNEESIRLASRLVEMDELAQGELVLKGPGRSGSTIMDELGAKYELVGKTKNGWYKAVNQATGEERNFRRKDFSVDESAPTHAGPQSLAPLDEDAARIVAMAEEISERPLEHTTISHEQQQKLANELESMGIDITAKELTSRWSPSEILYLRNTYNAMGKDLLQLAKGLAATKKKGGLIPDTELAYFNSAHAKFMAVRDLFYGVKGDAARQMNILQSRPKDQAYDFSDTMMDLISQKGGRNNTERAITALAELGDNDLARLTTESERLWNNKIAAAFLNVRYNMMLSSWRTHFFNFLGNTASGVWETGIISPIRMTVNNTNYVRDVARFHLFGEAGVPIPFTERTLGTALPDPAERLRLRSWTSELQGHYAAVTESLRLSKEIALGRDIGEGKVWNELGLRYDVVNVPNSLFGKLGTTPVRALEAGDAFFKNQYFSSKMHFLAERKARAEAIHQGLDFETRFHYWLDNYTPDMEAEAKAYGAKLTYTNDPNVYGGVLATFAKMMAEGQSRSAVVNWFVPFVRTPANLLSYSMEQIGANTILSPSKTWANLTSADMAVRQDAQSRIVAAVGLWGVAHGMYERGLCTGVGPTNWEERRSWENAGWQANSCKIGGEWVDMSRAAPGGQSLITMMSVFDWFALNGEEAEGPPTEWLGQFLLYTADMIKDESYLSTITDFIVSVESREASRGQALVASTINSFLVPNLARDVRFVTDEGKRTTASDNLLDQVLKQMQNAWPTQSDRLSPSRDAFGRPVNYYGNAYTRAMMPFNVRSPQDQDTAAMAIAYARVPMSVPPKNLSLPGRENFVDLFAMDEGLGAVYDQYVRMVGESRGQLANAVVGSEAWQKLVADDEIGPGSFGDMALRRAVSEGHRLGKAKFLQFLIDTESFTIKESDGTERLILIKHQFTKDQYREMMKLVMGERGQVPEDFPQYDLLERGEGPEFFRQ